MDNKLFKSMKKNIKISLFYLILILLLISAIEILFYLIYKLMVTEDRKIEISYIIGTNNNRSDKVGRIEPYLWSNYKLNPLSIHTNEFGWRYGGGEKKSKYRIICLGGSTTYGDAVQKGEETYPAQMENILKKMSYDIDIVNCGLSYYSSAECFATLAFRGVYLKPDIVILHIGLNDIEPLLSPNEYQPDYSHWRKAENQTNNNKFIRFWKAPSWTVKVLSLYFFNPASAGMCGTQITTWKEAALAKNNIDSRYPSGLRQNLLNSIAVCRGIGAIPIVVLDNSNITRKNSSTNTNLNQSDAEYANKRIGKALEINNFVMDSLAKSLNVSVIPFNEFKTSNEEYWVDQCHLNSKGEYEKAHYIINNLLSFNEVSVSLFSNKNK